MGRVLDAKCLLASQQSGETAESQEGERGPGEEKSWWLRDLGKVCLTWEYTHPKSLLTPRSLSLACWFSYLNYLFCSILCSTRPLIVIHWFFFSLYFIFGLLKKLNLFQSYHTNQYSCPFKHHLFASLLKKPPTLPYLPLVDSHFDFVSLHHCTPSNTG